MLRTTCVHLFFPVDIPKAHSLHCIHLQILQGMAIDSPEVQALLSCDKEEEPPFPGARRILNWEQRIVRAHHSHLVAE